MAVDAGTGVRRVLIFDFDGVVVHTEETHFASWRAAIRDFFDVDVEGDYRQVIGLSMADLMTMWIERGVLPATVREESVLEELLQQKTNYFFELGQHSLRPLEGIAELVRSAQQQGWYCAIASRGRRMRMLRTLELARIPAVFELVLSADDIVDPRTDRKNHAIAAHALGAHPADCVVIEDSVDGLLDACSSGIGRVVGITTSIAEQALLDSGAHEVIHQLAEFTLKAPTRGIV